jgi:uncharacterized protein (TIGR02996 family)
VDPQAFIDAIVDDPDDKATWVAYADWLCERGELRGEIISLASPPTTTRIPSESADASIRSRCGSKSWCRPSSADPRRCRVSTR